MKKCILIFTAFYFAACTTLTPPPTLRLTSNLHSRAATPNTVADHHPHANVRADFRQDAHTHAPAATDGDT